MLKGALVLLALPAVLAGCLAGEPNAVPTGPTGQIYGAVVDQLLRPFANQSVRLVQLDRVDQTSALGGFTFREVPVGFYTLTTSLEGGRAATQVVDVSEGRITRVILQLLPVKAPLPYFEAFPHTSPAEQPQAGTECEACAWSVPLDERRPAEVTLDAHWHPGLLLGDERDLLTLRITDDRGFTLYQSDEVTSPYSTSIEGLDIHPDAAELQVHVKYGNSFMPSRTFTMDSVLTLYYGATKAEMFQIDA